MGSEDIWIIGSNMTKFGKHPEKDVVDLASEASVAALRDAEMTMSDIGVLGVGNLMNAGAGIGQQLQKQIGQTGVPVFNVSNACATGATAQELAQALGLYHHHFCGGACYQRRSDCWAQGYGAHG